MPLKANWSRNHIFNDAWIDELSTIATLGYAAELKIYTIDITEPVFDPITGTYTGGTGETTVWSGSGRVQPISSASNINNNASDTLVQKFRFQISARTIDIRPDMYLVVTACSNNPVLLNYKYVIDEVADSSNLIERTFTAHVDTEVVNS